MQRFFVGHDILSRLACFFFLLFESMLEDSIYCVYNVIYLKVGPNWPNRQCCLAGSSQRAPRIFIFLTVLGAECLSYLKSIEPHARAFL